MRAIRLPILILGLLLAFPAVAKTISVPLGSHKLTIHVTRSGPGPTCVALHSNEATAIRAVAGLCGTTIILKNGGARDVSFIMEGVRYSFDPNRIFTPLGRQKTLKPQGSVAAKKALESLAKTITQEFSRSLIVGLHNNANGGYSILSYTSTMAKVAGGNKPNIVSGEDPDNFVLTTDSRLFKKAVAAGYNAVIDSGRVDDGSLSVYAKRAGRPYLNVEAEHGAVTWQRQVYQKLLRLRLES